MESAQCFIQTPSIGGELRLLGGSTVGNETETPKASRGWGMERAGEGDTPSPAD